MEEATGAGDMTSGVDMDRGATNGYIGLDGVLGRRKESREGKLYFQNSVNSGEKRENKKKETEHCEPGKRKRKRKRKASQWLVGQWIMGWRGCFPTKSDGV